MCNIFILKNVGLNTWGIFSSSSGRMIHEFRAITLNEAEEYIRAYISSWSSSTYFVSGDNNGK